MVEPRSDLFLSQLFEPLFDESKQSFPAVRPLLAHYTSIATLECIVKNDELWFSNPLFMNDLEELRFGLIEGRQRLRNHGPLRQACGTIERFDLLLKPFEHCFDQFATKLALDVSVFCMSAHDT